MEFPPRSTLSYEMETEEVTIRRQHKDVWNRAFNDMTIIYMVFMLAQDSFKIAVVSKAEGNTFVSVFQGLTYSEYYCACGNKNTRPTNSTPTGNTTQTSGTDWNYHSPAAPDNPHVSSNVQYSAGPLTRNSCFGRGLTHIIPCGEKINIDLRRTLCV